MMMSLKLTFLKGSTFSQEKQLFLRLPIEQSISAGIHRLVTEWEPLTDEDVV